MVLDTNVLLSSTLWDKSESQKLLFRLIKSGADIFCSREILDEYERVLKRDFEYGDEEAGYIRDKILSFAKLVEPGERLEIVKNDPSDDRILECAVAASADYLITYDKHLLKLKQFRGIMVVKPEEIFQ